MQTNTKAFAKLVQNKKLNTMRLLVTFDNTKKDKDGNIIITVTSAAYKSGDICNIADNADYKARCIMQVLEFAKQHLRTDNIMFV